ncbi:hypothetical protein SNK03_004377 [Fusarium graminearum]
MNTASLQSSFEAQMAEQYCPHPPTPGYLWDPILHVWRSPDSGLIKASHLFPSRQANFMNHIFDRWARRELLSPCNGLFLNPSIEKALHCGYIAIVPNVELDDTQPWWDIFNLSQSIHVIEWGKLQVKDYRVIVLDGCGPRIRQLFPYQRSDVFKEWGLLDGRKLVFQNDYRPRERYFWWTYLNTILHMVWRCQERCIKTGLEDEWDLRRIKQYWRTYGRYAKRSQIMGFLEHIDHRKARDLLNEVYEEEEDVEDSRPEAAEALLLEVIARSEEDGDDDYDDDEDMDSLYNDLQY